MNACLGTKCIMKLKTTSTLKVQVFYCLKKYFFYGSPWLSICGYTFHGKTGKRCPFLTPLICNNLCKLANRHCFFFCLGQIWKGRWWKIKHRAETLWSRCSKAEAQEKIQVSERRTQTFYLLLVSNNHQLYSFPPQVVVN